MADRNFVGATAIGRFEPLAGVARLHRNLLRSISAKSERATMSYKQGLDLIVEAARDVKQTHSNVHFVLSGQGSHKSKLLEMAANLENVHFLEIQADKRFSQLLVTADLHVIPQRAEVADLVLPSKLGGIFASGRPLITMASPGTGLAEEVADVGVIVPPGAGDRALFPQCHGRDANARPVLLLLHWQPQPPRGREGCQQPLRSSEHWRASLPTATRRRSATTAIAGT
jgi:glycosyltransferase involved in cell wall biosynthesis